MDAFQRSVGADDESLPRRDIEDGGVVADPLRGLPPFGEKDPNDVEFVAGAEVEISLAGATSTGRSAGGSISFQARGRA